MEGERRRRTGRRGRKVKGRGVGGPRGDWKRKGDGEKQSGGRGREMKEETEGDGEERSGLSEGLTRRRRRSLSVLSVWRPGRTADRRTDHTAVMEEQRPN